MSLRLARRADAARPEKVPEETILMLSKELADIDVLGRFKHIVD
ncbi:MAG: hypothetical protein ACLR76_09405 [Alistipes sp.]